MHMRAALACISEGAMLSAPGADFWEGPKRRGATGDAVFGNKYFPAYAHTPPRFDLGRRRGRKLFFGNRLDSCAALLHSVSRGAGMPNPSRFGACAAVEAVTNVHDLRDVTSVTSHTQAHENRMTSGGGRVTACVCANELQRFLSGGSCFHDTDDFPLRLAPASSTSYAHYTRRLTDRRSRVTVPCTAAS